MIFTYPAIFYALFFSDPVSRPIDNGNTRSLKKGEKTESSHRNDQPKK
jgi:hypothetical protein